MTVGDILVRATAKFPDKIAVICDDVQLTYARFNERVNRLAQAMTAQGLTKGERIGVLTGNCHQFLEIYFAAAKTGLIFCPYNNMLTPGELADLVNYSSPRWVFLEAAFADKAGEMAGSTASVEAWVCLDETDWDGAGDYEALLAAAGTDEPQVEIGPKDTMSIYFTSGTTGTPKGAMRCHNHLVSTAVTGLIENKIGYNERTMIAAPMSHVAFEDNIGRCFYIPNTTVVYRGGFDPGRVLKMLEEESITRVLLVPTMINAMIHSPVVGEVDLSALETIFYVGSPMPVELLKKSMAALGRFNIGFCQQYGATETGPLTTILPPEDHLLEGPERRTRKLASAGRPVLDYMVRVVDDDGNDVGLDQVGEIIVKSESMMTGYWQLPDQTADKVRDGWLYTGDMATMDEDGYIYIVDRKNDLIISGGKNIYPREIEEVLYEHPAVLEATVVGVPDEHWGEAVKAVITLQPDQQATVQEIIDFCGAKLASYKKPKTVEFWGELPKSASGKLLRRKVREKYWEGMDRNI